MRKIHKWLKKYFFPNEGNEYKPHFLRHESVLFFFLLIIIIELGLLVQVFIVFDKTKFLATVLPGVLTSMTNQENALLDKAAQLKAEDMAVKGYFAHTSPEGKTPWYWFDQVGYRYTYAGENLAVNFFETEDVANAWMNSPTHRANIVKKDYTEIGIGVALGIYQGRSTVFVAQLFAKPLVFPATKTITETPTAPTPPTKTVTPTAPKPKAPLPKVAVATPITASSGTPPKAVAPTAIKVLGEEATTSDGVILSGIAKAQFVIKSFIQKVLSSPRQYTNYIYGGIGLLIILVLLLMLFIKSELRHPAILARGMALIAIIFVLSYINILVFTSQTLVPESGLSANVIQALP